MSNNRVAMSNNGGISGMGYVEIDPSGRYGRLEDVIGKGSMKTVHRAFDEILGMEVAWSQIFLNEVLRSPEQLQRLYTEVHLLKSLDHDAIIKFHTSWIDSDRRTFNVITELFSSGSLRQYRQKYKQVNIRAIKDWSRQILCGLVYLHSQNPPVIHRDLKCDNIFVNGHLGQVKIGDLGLAAILQGSPHAHSVIGTPEFMAPELYEEKYNELVDIYSFGMCILEMLTLEFPYCECSNPAQIYKKVSAGKKPDAFYRIKDPQAKRFVGKCLESAPKRLPAHELLLDPFLSAVEPLPESGPLMQVYFSPRGKSMHVPMLLDDSRRSTDMTITGKMNPEDKTIFLKVKIGDKDGDVRNVHFPFDILNDTPMNVAMEMVRELDIADWEPSEIAEMIHVEIKSLVPEWKDGDRDPTAGYHQQHSFSYNYHDNDEKHHPPYAELSSPSPIHQSLAERFHDDLMINGDTSSESSYSSAYNYSDTKYSLANGSACNSRLPEISTGVTKLGCKDNAHHSRPVENSTGVKIQDCNDNAHNPRPAEIVSYVKNHGYNDDACNSRPESPTAVKSYGCTRFCGPEISKSPNKCDDMPDHSKHGGTYRQKKMSKIRSFMDVRTQLLHRALSQALHRGRLLKTVGAVEDIELQGEFSTLPRDKPKKSPR